MGIKYDTAKKMMDSNTFLEDLVHEWLKKCDNVAEKCPPSWKNLVIALRHESVRQNGIAQKIVETEI